MIWSNVAFKLLFKNLYVDFNIFVSFQNHRPGSPPSSLPSSTSVHSTLTTCKYFTYLYVIKYTVIFHIRISSSLFLHISLHYLPPPPFSCHGMIPALSSTWQKLANWQKSGNFHGKNHPLTMEYTIDVLSYLSLASFSYSFLLLTFLHLQHSIFPPIFSSFIIFIYMLFFFFLR